MKVKRKDVLKFLGTITIILLLIYLRSKNQYITLAFSLLTFSLLLILKVRKDVYLIFMLIPIFYANYSIAIGEFINKNLQVTFNSIRLFDYGKYVDALLMLCIFVVVLLFFLVPNNHNPFKTKNNPFIFYSLAVIVIFVNLIFFDRTESSTYIVRSNSLHGYTYLLVLFMSYFSGGRKNRKIITLIIVGLIALQSLVYGGRQAVIPTVIISLLTVFYSKLNYKNILVVTSLGIIVLTIIGQLRGTAEVGLSTILELFRKDYFVQDTSVYAFNSSVTHIAAEIVYSNSQRIQSFVAFLLSIFVGQDSSFTQLGNVTIISDSLNNNLGGGIISTYFYFWLGWGGVLVIPFIIVWIINKLNRSKSELQNLMLIGIVATTSTWYLYSPLQFFRIITVFIPLLYFVCCLIDRETKKIARGYEFG